MFDRLRKFFNPPKLNPKLEWNDFCSGRTLSFSHIEDRLRRTNRLRDQARRKHVSHPPRIKRHV